jgi:3-carboxy-cis,cis-muconate cycloisomerase
LFDAYFTARDMREVFCDQGRQACSISKRRWPGRGAGRVIPASAVAPIAAACQAGLYDFAALGEAIATAGNSAIPLVKALGKQIAARCRGRALCASGRHQSGRDGQRAGPAIASALR